MIYYFEGKRISRRLKSQIDTYEETMHPSWRHHVSQMNACPSRRQDTKPSLKQTKKDTERKLLSHRDWTLFILKIHQFFFMLRGIGLLFSKSTEKGNPLQSSYQIHLVCSRNHVCISKSPFKKHLIASDKGKLLKCSNKH